MKARLLPLEGKYYGTRVAVEDGSTRAEFLVWCNADYEPSDREFAECGITRAQYEANELVDDGLGGKCPAKEMEIVDSSHFESQWTLDLCNRIIRALND